LRELNDEVMSKKLHFFDSKPTVMWEEGGFSDSFGRETQFYGGNPSRSAQIKYYLKKRHTFGKMTMQIQDMDGNVISDISPGKAKGINIVDWNYSMKNPKVAKGKTFSFGGFTSPRVEAGTYKVVIKKGRDTFEHKFDVVYDDKSPLTASDRKAKHNTTMKMYDMTQDLAYMVYELDAIVEKATEMKKKKLVKGLTELKETLVITTGDNYVGSAEPQLREKMADLYSKIAGSYDKPSNAELESLAVVEERFEKAKKDYAKLRKKAKFVDELGLKTFEEFVK
jgi:hypothetical protein